MAIRTDEGAVKSLLMDNYGNLRSGRAADLDTFLISASVLVGRMRTTALSYGFSHTEEELEIIERWLSAHFYACSDQMPEEEGTLKSKTVYQGKTGMRLEATKFGQMAMVLDTSGILSKMNKSNLVRVAWVGTHPKDARDVLDTE